MSIMIYVLGDNEINHVEYDYIVVGSATGGVVASRLSESGYHVLLIEAGPNDLTYSCNNCKAYPYDYGILLGGTTMVPFKGWWYNKVDDLQWHNTGSMPSYYNYNKSILNRREFIYKAKMLGGCLSHNGHGWMRGSTRDYDYVSYMNNLSDWSFKNILPYFQKIETYLGENKTMRGTTGPIEIIPLKIQPFEFKLQAIFDTAINYGIPFNNHQNGGYSQFGIGFGEANIGKFKNGKVGLFNTTFYRESSSQMYIRNIGIPTEFLTVWYNKTVQRVLFDNNKPKPNAIGVEYWNNDQLYSVYCKKEVIISAGAYQSPQLLLLSGIGPLKQLNKFNITSINHIESHENIGKYGQDHTFFKGFSYEIKPKTKPLPKPQRTLINKYFGRQQKKRTKIFYNQGQIDLILSSGKYNRLGFDYNDIRITCFEINFRTKTYCQIDSSGYSKNVTIELNSTDSRKYPLIYNNFFSDSRDYDIVIEGIHKLRSIFQFNKSIFIKEIYPGTDKNEQELKDIIFKKSSSSIHTVATISMGDENDDYSNRYPVTSKCSLRGVNGVRIIDASIWPYSPNGGIQSLVFMIGEKCAKHVIDDNHNNKILLIQKHEKHQDVAINQHYFFVLIFVIHLSFIVYLFILYNKYNIQYLQLSTLLFIFFTFSLTYFIYSCFFI